MRSDRFSRDIPLAQYAAKHGYETLERASNASVTVLAHPQTDHCIGVSRDPRGHWRYDTIVRFATDEEESPQARRIRLDALDGKIEGGDIATDALRRLRRNRSPRAVPEPLTKAFTR